MAKVGTIRARQRDADLRGVGHRLAQLRKAAGFTQAEVAIRMGADQGRVSRIEHGLDLHLSTLHAFAEAIGATLRIEAGISESSVAHERMRDLFDVAPGDEDQLVFPILEDEPLRPGRDVVLSVKPGYSAAIMAGRKTVELRRRFPIQAGGKTLAYIYSTTPDKALVGTAEIDFVQKGQVGRLWSQHARGACIEKADFDRYFNGLDEGFALHLRHTRPLEQPISLPELRERFGFEPPQSFLYAKPELRDVLRHQLAEVPH